MCLYVYVQFQSMSTFMFCIYVSDQYRHTRPISPFTEPLSSLTSQNSVYPALLMSND